MTPQTSLTVRTPSDLLAALPFMLGFHPAQSVAVVAVHGGRAFFAGRHDLPPPGEEAAGARYLAWIVRKQGADAAAVIGYGDPARVTPAVLGTAKALRRLSVEVFEMLRVTGGRYWSYASPDCPAAGWPCPPEDSEVAAVATYAGQVALPDRESLVARLDPVTGDERRAMTPATERARARLRDLLGRRQGDLDRTLRRAGHTAVRDAERRYRAGGRLPDDEVAWLGLLLVDLAVRDYAWERTGDDDWQIALWTDVLRRVEPRYVPAPACLLAFAAWRAGQGVLALTAVDRALAEDDGYRMALLLAEVLAAGISPAIVDDWPALAGPGSPPHDRPVRVTP